MSYLKKSKRQSKKRNRHLRLVSESTKKQVKSATKKVYPTRLTLVWGVLIVAIFFLLLRLFY